MLESIVDVVCAINKRGVFQFVSPACYELFGYSPEEMTGATFLDFIHPDDTQKTFQIIKERTPGCQTSNFENRYIKKDGSIAYIIWSGRWDEKDQLLYCVARNGAENQMIKQRLQKAQQVAKVANYEFDVVNNRYTYTSDTIFDIFGLDRKQYPQFTRELFWSLVHPDDLALVEKHVLQPKLLFKDQLEYRIIRPDGTVVYINRIREVIWDSEGKPIKNIGMIQDITDRKIVELTLQQSEERFRSLVQNGSDLLGIINEEGQYLFVGENVQEQLGFHPHDMVGKNALEFIHPDDAGWVGAVLQEISFKKSLSLRPFRFKNSKGEWRWIETIVSNHMKNPSIRALVVNSRDITDKKYKDDELQKLSLIAQESQNPIVITTPSCVITWANKAFYNLSKFSGVETIEKRIDEVFITDSLDLVTRLQIQENISNGKTVHTDGKFFSKTGTGYWLDLTLQPIFNEQKEIIYLLVIGKEITERKKAEQALLLSEQRFKALVQNGSDLIVIIDEKANFTYVSDNVITVLGYAPEEMVGRNAFDYIHHEDAEKVVCELARVIQDGTSANCVEHRFLHKSGNWIWLESKGTNNSDNESINGIIVNSRNISERVILKKQLEREQRKRHTQIAAASLRAQEHERSVVSQELHDNVNQVLTTVKLYTEMCRDGFGNREEITNKSIRLLQESISEIRSLSKRLSAPSLGKIKLAESISELVEAVAATNKFEVSLDTNEINELDIDQEAHLAIYRILQEHLTNILKHAGASSIVIQLEFISGYIHLRVTDDGKGFNPGKKSPGIGIANMITRAESLQGTITIESAPGKGCMLLTRIPLLRE